MVLGVISLMYQESPAQKKRPKQSIVPAAEMSAQPPEIAYTIGMSKPWTHLIEVETHVRWAQMPAKLEMKMPVWTPGSYLIREYARQVQDFDAKDASGNLLKWEKTNKNTWSIESKGAEVVINYKVYANELTVRTNELNDEHGFWNNAATLMFVKDQLKGPSTVTVKPFGNWKVATGLPKAAGTNTFRR